jgi:VanZ family protein
LLSSAPDLPGQSWLPSGDKIAHLVLYGVLGATLAWGHHSSGRRISHVLLVLAGLLYGVSDEWHQSFVPGRNPSAGDLAADGVGTLVGYSASIALLRRRDPAEASPLRPRPPSTR